MNSAKGYEGFGHGLFGDTSPVFIYKDLIIPRAFSEWPLIVSRFELSSPFLTNHKSKCVIAALSCSVNCVWL